MRCDSRDLAQYTVVRISRYAEAYLSAITVNTALLSGY